VNQKLPNASVDLFEASDIGGRLKTTSIAGREYEVGGSIIHPRNKLMVDFTEKVCGRKKKADTPDLPTSLWSGGKNVVTLSAWSWYNTAQMVWRYGPLSLWRLKSFVDDLLNHFGRIYDHLDNGTAFRNVTGILRSMYDNHGDSSAVVSLLSSTLADTLRKQGVGEALIAELCRIATRVNYGQLPEAMHSFVGGVSIAGTEGDLWAVEGGNYRIPECLLMKSGAKHLKERVTQVELLQSRTGAHRYRLTYGTQNMQEDYDIVVVASPQTSDEKNRIHFSGVDVSAANFVGKYHRTVATIVNAKLRLTSLQNYYLDDASNFISVAPLYPVDYTPDADKDLPSVFKVFSKLPLTASELADLFIDAAVDAHEPACSAENGKDAKRCRKEEATTQVFDWLAYPDYEVNQTLQSFVLAEGLFYTSAIEMAASAMEMSSLAGKNVANLVVAYHEQSLKKAIMV